MIKITKKQEYVDDVAGEVTYKVELFRDEGNYSDEDMELSPSELLELKEALNNLDIK